MVKTTTMKFREVLSEVMKMAHRNYSSKYNTHTWAECLSNAWFAMKVKIRRGFVKVQKMVRVMVKKQPRVQVSRMDYSDIEPWVLGYGRGPGFYCGD